MHNLFYTQFFLITILVFSIVINDEAQISIIKRDPQIESMVKEINPINLERTIKKLVSFGTRHSLSNTKSSKEGIGAARRWVKSEFEKYSKDSGGRLVVSFDPFTVKPNGKRISRQVIMKNVVATLKGSDPNDNRIFVISGHLDSRNSNIMDSTGLAPGADDDGSGVAVVMELARIMSKREFPATIVFLAVSGEEQGLYGSKHFAEKAKRDNWNIVAMLNNDMVGSDNSSGTNLKDNINMRIFSEGIPAYETKKTARLRKYTNGENDSKSRELARYVKEVGERYVNQININLIYRDDRFLRGGDQMSFSREGFTAVRFCEMHENYNHQHQNVRKENGIQYGDLPQFVDYEYVRKIAGVDLAVLSSLSLAPPSPRNVRIDVSKLSNFSKLKWDAPKGEAPAGYFVLMRKTYQPFWQKKIFVKNRSITLPYSKDNYFFAVQSVDKQGHESLPVFPMPIWHE